MSGKVVGKARPRALGMSKHAHPPRGVDPTIRWVGAQPGVDRVIVGRYRAGKKIVPLLAVAGPAPGGLRLLARGEGMAVELFARTDDPDALAGRVAARFGRPG